ncbi:MAG: thiamine pyrophosphate-dependent enzyme [Caldilineaceae bacterium]
MLVIRWCEEQLARNHAAGLVHGACHTYVGEEAVAVGVAAHLRPEDAVFSTHRGHGHALAKGVHPRALIAELLGRVSPASPRPWRQYASLRTRVWHDGHFWYCWPVYPPGDGGRLLL